METATLRKGKILGPASFYKKALLIALPVMPQMLIQNMVCLLYTSPSPRDRLVARMPCYA